MKEEQPEKNHAIDTLSRPLVRYLSLTGSYPRRTVLAGDLCGDIKHEESLVPTHAALRRQRPARNAYTD